MSDLTGLEQELARFRRQAGASPGFTIDAMRMAMQALRNPQDAIPPAIHITGTNGKGSTGAFVRAIAEAAGMRVHAFTSPHLMRVNERIRLAGELVEDEVLRDALEEVGDYTDDLDQPLSYFEALTAAAFLLFSRNPADLCVIEVGAGGATDATNVMTRPAASVVTPISRDHEAMFNVSGVAAIARLKSGIFRAGVPAILSEQSSIALGVLREEARAIGAETFESGRDWRAGWEGQAFTYAGAKLSVRAPWLGLRGAHQAQNAGVACAVFETLNDPRIHADAISAGLREAVWPGRLQQLARGPLTGATAAEVWLDAAHNPGGAEVLAEALLAMRAADEDAGEPKRTAIILACQAAKDSESLLRALAPAAERLIACPLPDSGGQEGGPGADPAHIAQVARMVGLAATTAPDFAAAVHMAQAGGSGRIVICGSVYLCGSVLRANAESVT